MYCIEGDNIDEFNRAPRVAPNDTVSINNILYFTISNAMDNWIILPS